MLMTPQILDVTCSGRMMWFDKKNPLAIYTDKRMQTVSAWNYDRKMDIKPDVVCDFTELPFRNEFFHLVVFDPPHMDTLGDNSRTAAIYGKLFGDWGSDLAGGFAECFRVLKIGGTLIFKWNSTDIPVSKILKLTEQKPLFGHLSGKHSQTHWIAFLKHNQSLNWTAKSRRQLA